MKKIDIDLVCDAGKIKNVAKEEYPHLCLDYEISDGDLNNALDIVINAFMQRGLYKISVDLDKRNYEYAPTKEMTMADIEKEFGHKVRIVANKEEII